MRAQLDAHLRDRPAPPADGPAFARSPRWMRRNAEMRGFIGWLREHNAGRSSAQRVVVRGLDIYSLGASIEAVLAHLDAEDLAAAQPRLERALGVIYRPETERRRHWFEAALPDQSDAFAWIAETCAVTPLDTAGSGAADPFPFGL